MTVPEVHFVLRDLPGVAELEQMIAALEDHANAAWDPAWERAEAFCCELEAQLFGINSDEIEPGYLASITDNPEASELLAKALGWDVGSKAGETLECFPWLAGPLLYAARGCGGHLPDPNHTASVERWASALKDDVDQWRKSNRRQTAGVHRRG